ncbi:hypothetical protein [Mucilaginibacter flavus]|uniref:hypothetical protein n=1 Tax=Mucilaginibacter flavus TaxID=931504 RepID=UPI0025B6194C|nr:hypothetical protein [Mucilaginibacter flavus]MDN3580248.1 hypothetical protein [Mucilaginibacter flavus]
MTFTLGQFFPKKQINEPYLQLDDPRWADLEGGYKKSTYDASVALLKLEKATTLAEVNVIYQELWDELHHQGDVSFASYYAVPHLTRIAKEKQLVDFNVLGMVMLIEICRHKNNPPLPKALLPAFQNAITELGELGVLAISKPWDLSLASCALASIALAKGQTQLAEAIFNLDDDGVIEEFLEGG